MAESVSQVLGKMQGAWDQSQAAYDTTFGGLKVPEGSYDARLTGCGVKVSQQGNPMINREFTIMNSAEHDGAKVFDRLMLGTEKGPVYVRRFIDQCGYDQPKLIKDLEKLCAKISAEGLEFQIQVKHNDDFVNVNILKPLSEAGEGEGGEGEGEGEAEAGEGEAAEGTEAGEAGEGEGEAGGDDAEAEELRTAAITYARSQGITLEDDTAMDEVLAEMSRYEYKEEHSTPEELDLLNRLGLSDSIVKAPPKAAPKPAPKPAPKSAPAPAKPAGKAAPAPGKPAGKPAPKPAGKPLPGKKK